MSRLSGVKFIPSCEFLGSKMAKGIVATLKEALLQEGVTLDVVDRMLQSRTGRLYFVLDSMEKLISDVAHRTKLLLNQGKVGDFQTLAEAIESLRNPMKNVTIIKEPPENLKREILENTWFPVKKLCTGRKQNMDIFIIMKKKKVGESIRGCIKLKECQPQKENVKENLTGKDTSCSRKVSEVSGLDLLAQAAASCVKVPDLVTECPTLTKLLNDK